MQFDVYRLLSSQVGTTEEHELNFLLETNSEDFKAVSPVVGSINLIRTEDSVLLTGMATIKVETVCAKCLDSFITELSFSLEQEFFEVKMNAPVVESEFKIIDNKIEIDKLILDEILVKILSNQICKEDCKGLCKVCFENLNSSSCQH